MLLQIISHTPAWVFLLFGFLVLVGLRQLRGGPMPAWRLGAMPVAMAAFSLYGVDSAFAHSAPALAAWAFSVAAVVAAGVMLPGMIGAGARYDAASRRYHVPGSAVPLVLMMAIFFTKYAVSVLQVMHPDLRQHAAFALAVSALYGAFSGIFLARAIRLWQLAWGRTRMLAPSQPAPR